jgi:hypothetical protein
MYEQYSLLLVGFSTQAVAWLKTVGPGVRVVEMVPIFVPALAVL